MSLEGMSIDERNEIYNQGLLLFMEKFQDQLDAHNKQFNTTLGFIALMIRDLSEGNVDVAHNFTDESKLITVLELAIETIKKGHKKQTLNP